MASRLRKSIVLGPAGCIWPGSEQDFRVGNNRAWFNDTGTRWVHMWADWPSLEPAAGALDSWKLESLDAQVAAVRGDGRKAMLTMYRFPGWANGTDALTAEQLAATMPDRRGANQADTQAKPLEYRYPTDLSESGPWARFLEMLLRRYAGKVDVVQICVKPNHKLWPQQGPSTTSDPYAPGPVTIYDTVAQMFVTAQAIQTRVGSSAPVLAGPTSSDTTNSDRLSTPYDMFTSQLLTKLAARGFKPGPRFAYSHHSHNDLAYDHGPGSTSPDAATNPTRLKNRAAEVRKRLVKKWAGWPDANADKPQLMLTEAAVTLGQIETHWGLSSRADQLAKQAELLKRSWDRMVQNKGDGAGIAMLSHYLLHTDVHFDCGLCERPEAGGATRPAYATWKSFPTYD